MRIVQSYWSCSQTDLLKFNAGWLSPEYNLMAWALSCLQLTKHYSKVVLYADTLSAKLLIDTLKLPYTEVVCNLDSLNNYHPKLWALPKIHTYSLQEEPFLHVDGDVFIWKPFDTEFLNNGLVSQNMESATSFYESIMKLLEVGLNYFPSEIQTERDRGELIYAYNAGIFGGTDIDFFKRYTGKAFQFVNSNLRNLDKINPSDFNIFFEQYLFYCMAKRENKKVAVLIPELIDDIMYGGFGDFIEVPHNKQYLHLLGNYKRSEKICNELANRLRQDYPEYYYRIIALFKNNHLPLFKDYYTFVNTTEENLTKRHNVLKLAFQNETVAVNKGMDKDYISQFETNNNPLTQIVKNTATNLQSNIDNDIVISYDLQIADIVVFENKIRAIVDEKFDSISLDYLYARDINHTFYFQYLFENKNTTYKKVLVVEGFVEIIESQFDWTDMFFKETLLGKTKLLQQFELAPSVISTAIIPECTPMQYSMQNIDDLDILILQIAQQPISIENLFTQLTPSFDIEEIENDPEIFEKLIFLRIKMLLQSKVIKAIITNE